MAAAAALLAAGVGSEATRQVAELCFTVFMMLTEVSSGRATLGTAGAGVFTDGLCLHQDTHCNTFLHDVNVKVPVTLHKAVRDSLLHMHTRGTRALMQQASSFRTAHAPSASGSGDELRRALGPSTVWWVATPAITLRGFPGTARLTSDAGAVAA
jgi:hypothetical protein